MKCRARYVRPFRLKAIAVAVFVLTGNFASQMAVAADMSAFSSPANEKALVFSLLAEAAYSKRESVGVFERVKLDQDVRVSAWNFEDRYIKRDKWVDLHSTKKLENGEDPDTGFKVVLYRNKETGKYVISFAGTDNVYGLDAATDQDQAIDLVPPQYIQAVEYTKAIIAKVGAGNVEITGHSLGGGLAQYAALTTGVPAIGFNSVRLGSGALSNVGPGLIAKNEGKISHYRVDDDAFSAHGGTRLVGSLEPELKTQNGSIHWRRDGEYDEHKAATVSELLAERSRKLGYLDATFMDDSKISVVLEEKAKIDARNAIRDVDVFFLADNTGSMGSVIGAVKANAQAILDKLSGSDSRFAKVRINIGVGNYQGDPTEWGETPASAYRLQQKITNSKTLVTDAINAWTASGGGDWEEANFYAIQQVATGGVGTPRDGSKSSGQKTGWGEGSGVSSSPASKVIVVFGDAPSWQSSVNEKELRKVLADNGVSVSFIDASGINSAGSNPVGWNATSGAQLQGAAQELADGSNGAYIHLVNKAKIVDAIMNAVYDAIANNKWGGGHLARLDAATAWRNRTPSAVEVVDGASGNIVKLTLRYPGLDDSTLQIDTGSATLVPGKIWYEKTLTGAQSLFGASFKDSVVDFTPKLDFFRYDLRNSLDTNKTQLAGYYGQILKSHPSSGMYFYDMVSWTTTNLADTGAASRSGVNSMRLAANWGTGTVFGADSSPPGIEGFGFYMGMVGADGKVVDGVYVAKSSSASTNPRFIADAARGNTTLQLYGASEPVGLGGTFSTNWYDQSLNATPSALLMAGFLSEKLAQPASSGGTTYKGFTAGLRQDRTTNATEIISNTDANDVSIGFAGNRIEGQVTAVTAGGAETYGVTLGASDQSMFVSPKMFGGVATVNGAPAYIATAMSGMESYSSLSWGYWSVDASSGGTEKTVFPKTPWIAGRLTAGTELQGVAGTASYYGDVRGALSSDGVAAIASLSGTTTLTANFGTRNLDGTFDNLKRADTNTNWIDSAVIHASWAGANAITGTVTGNASPVGGSLCPCIKAGAINGAFFGSAAQEVGGNWNMAGGGDKAAGIFAAKK